MWNSVSNIFNRVIPHMKLVYRPPVPEMIASLVIGLAYPSKSFETSGGSFHYDTGGIDYWELLKGD
jgi:hypothetical protein